MSSSFKRPRLRLDHVGIAVPDLEAARAQYALLLGAEPSSVETVPAEQVKVCFFELEGCRIELLEPTSPDSPVARFLAQRQSGVHHVSISVDGVQLGGFRADLERQGVELIGDATRRGSEQSDIFFVHPRSTAGVLVEFLQKRITGEP